jgi:DNA-directed RNA polymerase subunit K/omega
MEEKSAESKTMDSVSSFANKYELAIIAAKEARRINEVLRRSGEEPKERITLYALDRVQKGKVRYRYEAQEGKSE